MAARSSIARLPQELLDVCHRLIREGKTIHEITDKLNRPLPIARGKPIREVFE